LTHVLSMFVKIQRKVNVRKQHMNVASIQNLPNSLHSREDSSRCDPTAFHVLVCLCTQHTFLTHPKRQTAHCLDDLTSAPLQLPTHGFARAHRLHRGIAQRVLLGNLPPLPRQLSAATWLRKTVESRPTL